MSKTFPGIARSRFFVPFAKVQQTTQRGIAATKGIKATTDYTDFTDGKRRTKRKMNLNSRTHEQINQPDSRQGAEAQRGRERRGNLAGKQEIAGKQEESRFNHRGPPRGTEGHRGGEEKREGRGRQYSIFNKESSMFKGKRRKVGAAFLVGLSADTKWLMGSIRTRNVFLKHGFEGF